MTRTIHVVKERGRLSLPLGELIDADGTLRLIELAQNRGVIQITQGRNALELTIGRFVGRIALTKSIALDIQPKFPIANLSEMMVRSGMNFEQVSTVVRHYGRDPQGSLFEPLIQTFAVHLGAVHMRGLHKTYVETKIEGIPRPRIDFRVSDQKYWSRGHLTKARSREFRLSANTQQNRLLKAAALRTLPLVRPGAPYLGSLHRFLQSTAQVTPLSGPLVRLSLAQLLKGIPSDRTDYMHALPIAYELCLGAAVLLDDFSAGVALPSYLVCIDDVFEAYIRKLIQRWLPLRYAGWRAKNGRDNRYAGYLFSDKREFRTHPDLVLQAPPRESRIIGDVKYKPKLDEADRYQIIAHALSYSCKSAFFVRPTEGLEAPVRHIGRFGAGTYQAELFEIGFPLSAPIDYAEEQFVGALAGLIESDLQRRLPN